MAVDKNYQIDQNFVLVDTRTFFQIIWDFITEFPSPPSVLALSIIVLLLQPGLLIPIVAIAIVIGKAYKARPDVLPLHLPFFADTPTDKHDPAIGKVNTFNKPQGIIYFGNIINSLEEIYAKFESILRHIILIGTTGAGKTEALLSLFCNFLAIGSGGNMTDAKGTSTFYVQMSSMCRFFGCEDDVLVTNFNKGNTSERFDPADRITHTMAPFSFGSSDTGTQLINSLMPEDSGGGNKVFLESAVALISAMYPALVDLRDLNLLQIDPKTIRKYSNYTDFCQLMRNPMISDASRQSMVGFIRTRSGYNDKKAPDKQPEEVTKQFGFAQAYFVRCLQMLADTYGNIYMYGTGELDFRDAILNDRVVCTILPSMTKSIQELGSLGKLILSAKKASYAIGLGVQIQGDVEDIVDSLAMSSNKPIIDINDEYAFMATKGYAITAAQCRGIKVVVCIAGQDWAGIKKADPDEAEQFWSNSRVKIFMATEGDSETWPKIKEMASSVYAYVRKGKVVDENGMGSDFVHDKSISLEKVDALQLNDLRKLNEGQGVLFFQDKMMFIQNFFHGYTRENFVSKIRIFTAVRPIYTPTRGKYAALFEEGNLGQLPALKVWLRNLEPGDIDLRGNVVPKRLKTVVDFARNDPFYDRLDSAAKGLALIHAFKNAENISQSIADEKLLGSSTNVLSNQSGTFGGGNIFDSPGSVDSSSKDLNNSGDVMNAADIINDMFNAARSGAGNFDFNAITKMFDDSSENKEIPAPKTSKGISLSNLDQFTPSVEPPSSSGIEYSIKDNFNDSTNPQSDEDFVNDDSDEIFSPSYRERIAIGTSKIEEALGQSPLRSREIGLTTADAVMESTRYPQTTMVKTSEKREIVKNILVDFVNGNKGR